MVQRLARAAREFRLVERELDPLGAVGGASRSDRTYVPRGAFVHGRARGDGAAHRPGAGIPGRVRDDAVRDHGAARAAADDA